MTTFVTSFSDTYYQDLGRDMLRGFLKHWPFKIIAYYEDTRPDLEHERLELRCLYDLPHVVEYLNAFGTIPFMRGITKPGGKENYHFAIFRWARKIFAECHAAATIRTGKMCWIDADVQIRAPLPDNWIEDRFKDGDFMLYMPRKDYTCCSSFVAWNQDHIQANKFWNNYLDMLLSGRFLKIDKGWGDAVIMETVMDLCKVSAKDLAEGTGCTYTDNVFDAVFDGIAQHNKGAARKNKALGIT